MRYPVVPALLLLALAACGGDGFDAGQYDVTDRWTGAALGDSLRIELQLEQNEEEISGTGTLRAPRDTVEVEVRGEFAFPGVNLRLSAPGFVPVALTGAFERDTISPATPTAQAVLRESRSRISGTLAGSALTGSFRILRDTIP